jgi:pimeloyl-ACP methyl ester carboxylesterase
LRQAAFCLVPYNKLQMQNHFIETNNIRLHYLEFKAEVDRPTIIMIHGITANAHAFDGIIHSGLFRQFNIICPDLRGRGLSSKPAFSYTLRDHALDIIGLLDHLNIEAAMIVGHSYGGLLTAYLCAHFPKRVNKIIFLDAAAELNPNSAQMLEPIFARLSKVYDSYDDFINSMKSAPQITEWDPFMESYYCADIQMREDGRIDTIPNITNMSTVALAVINNNWKQTFATIKVSTMLVCGTEAYTMGEPLLPPHKARETAALMEDCQLEFVNGNHQTMLYGKNAAEIAQLITEFFTNL